MRLKRFLSITLILLNSLSILAALITEGMIAGHRNLISRRPFRYLNLLKNGDRVAVKAGGRLYTYEMSDSFTVAPEDVWVLRPVEGESRVLTLVTCGPVLNPVSPLIVRARLVETAEA